MSFGADTFNVVAGDNHHCHVSLGSEQKALSKLKLEVCYKCDVASGSDTAYCAARVTEHGTALDLASRVRAESGIVENAQFGLCPMCTVLHMDLRHQSSISRVSQDWSGTL